VRSPMRLLRLSAEPAQAGGPPKRWRAHPHPKRLRRGFRSYAAGVLECGAQRRFPSDSAIRHGPGDSPRLGRSQARRSFRRKFLDLPILRQLRRPAFENRPNLGIARGGVRPALVEGLGETGPAHTARKNCGAALRRDGWMIECSAGAPAVLDSPCPSRDTTPGPERSWTISPPPPSRP